MNIGIFSPSDPITENRIDRFRKGCEILLSQGHTLVYSENYLKNIDNIVAGSIFERINDLNSVFSDSSIDAIIGSWGGKLSNQLLPFINTQKFSIENYKKFYGFSDLCVLLNHMSVLNLVEAYYGPNIVGKLYESSCLSLNTDQTSKGNSIFDNSYDLNWIQKGNSTGLLYGGNLSTFCLGMSEEVRRYLLSGIEIVYFFESTTNDLRIVSQYFTYLYNLRLLSNCKGIIIGNLGVNEHLEIDNLISYLKWLFNQLKFKNPVVFNPCFGHGRLPNKIIRIGAPVEIRDTINDVIYL